jgi:hypothetical protein
MRKLICTGFLFGVLSLALGSAPSGAVLSPPNCRYVCTCAGQALKCCTSGSVEVCNPTSEIGCTQGYNC